MRLGAFSGICWTLYDRFLTRMGCGNVLCFFSVIEFGIGPEFFPGYDPLSNWNINNSENNSETILGRCYCYFRDSWPNFPTRSDCMEFVVEDGVFFLW